MKILFVNSPPGMCGVYQYGDNFYRIIKEFPKMEVVLAGCNSVQSLRHEVEQTKPDFILYNWHLGVGGWVSEAPFSVLPKQVLIYHDLTANVNAFAAVLFSDPTMPPHDNWHPIGRPLYIPNGQPYASPQVGCPVIGVHGFGGAQAVHVVARARNEFPECHIRIHSPQATFGDPGGGARATNEQQVQSLMRPGMKLSITHDPLSWPDLLYWLSENHINCYFRDAAWNWTGISSALDAALCARRPIAINHCNCFRHLWDCKPSIRIDQRNVAEILADGLAPLIAKYELWSPERFANQVFGILEKIA